MLNRMLQSSSIPMLQEVIGFSQARHAVLAGNLANVHTPGYRTRDLSVDSFHEALKKAFVEKKERPAEMSSGMGSIDDERIDHEQLQDVRDSMKNVLYHDDTNLDVEKQVLEITKNQSLHGMAIAIMTNQMRLLETAVSERV